MSPPQFEELENPGPAAGRVFGLGGGLGGGPGVGSAEGASAAPGPSVSKHGPPGATTERGHDTRASKRRRPPIWLSILLVVAAFAVALGWQFRVAGQLEQEVLGLQQELRETHVLLGAHKARLGEIRGVVHDLATRLGGLRVLVDADPSGAAPVVAVPVDDPGALIPAPLPAE